ncbi:hypothetical protein IAT38_007248 [Cryptococcus sp. DSM 104549]
MAALPQHLHVHPHFNAEEAAHVVTGVVASLDNLPGEVTFLLEEIREKDVRINQLMQRINSRHMSLTKGARALASQPPTTATFPLPLPPGSPIPTTHLSQKDSQSLAKIQTEWDLVESLQEEKVKLAERLERIVSRAKERAKYQWTKVGGMEVEEVEKTQMGEMGGGDVVLPPTGLGSGVDGRPLKKRKPNALPLPPTITHPKPIVHPSIAMPPPPPPPRPSLSARSSHSQSLTPLTHPPSTSHSGHHGDRHGGSSHRSRKQSIMSDDVDADGEPEDEIEVEGPEGGEAEGEADETLYCTCQQKSYGEMVGCDSGRCPYEWFHVKCVDISGPLPDTWYCPDCVRNYGLSNDKGRKGRKK